MKKIVLISDTHGWLDPQIEGFCEGYDELWHAGDIGRISLVDEMEKILPTRAVYGNIDDAKVRVAIPLDACFQMDQVNVWITHIGGYPGRYEPRVRAELAKQSPDLFICGHSHILKVQHDPKYKMLCMNPGAAGKHGFHKIRTLLRFSIEGARIDNLEVVELGSRAKA